MSTSTVAAAGDTLHPVRAVVGRLGISRATVYELLATGDLRSVKLGGRRLVRESEIQRFIGGLPETTPGGQS